MSILTITHEDTIREGRDLPEGVYRATIEVVQVQESAAKGSDHRVNKQLYRQYGNLRTRDGATEFALPSGAIFRIGGRKTFSRSWIDHVNPQATEIGNREIKREALAAGIVAAPGKDEPAVDLPYETFEEYAEALAGREVIVRVRHRQQKDATGKLVQDERGQPKISVEVADWLTV